MKKIFLNLVHFWIWWYRGVLIWFVRFYKNLIIFLDNKLAVSLMLRMLFVPLFHDTTIVGRSLSLIFRLIRVVIGSLVLLTASAMMIFWLVCWLGLPVVMISYNLGGYLLVIWLVDGLWQLSIPGESSRLVSKYLKKAKHDSQKMLQFLLRDKQVVKLLNRVELSEKSFSKIHLILIMDHWVKLAKAEAKTEGKNKIDSAHMILALLKAENLKYAEAKLTLDWLKKEKSWLRAPFLWDKEYQVRPIGGVNRSWTGIPTPTLDKYSSDLTRMAQKSQLPEILGKEAELTKAIEILSRKQRDNLLIVGEPGSGKTTLVKGLAQEIIRGTKAKSLRFKRLVSLDTARFASSANSAELNYRITKIVEEISKSENIILFVDEVHNLASLNQDSPETSDLFIALEPPLSEGKFQFIGTTSSENYKKYIEPNEAFSRLLDVLELKNADNEETMAVLQYEAFKQELSEKVMITTTALNSIIQLSDRLVFDRVFPDKAVDLLDEVVSRVKQENKLVVTAGDVIRVISEKTKVPMTDLTKEEKVNLLNLEVKLHQRVIGQDQAIRAVADAIRRARTKIKDPSKPIASFMFAGPTGVGKTETAKTLAKEFFGSEKMMVRLDMSEYQNLDSLNRLIGAPPGGRGVDSGGQLTEAIRHQPYALLLLDEIEKAHPQIINLFLQVLDDARLTDSQGKVVDFSNTIIIATTNVGTREIIEKTMKPLSALEKHFAPEFLNRFNGLIVFKTLTKKETKEIVKLKLKDLREQLKKQEVEIKFSDQVVESIADQGFSQKWGGRQVSRVIQEKIMNVIAKKILTGEIKKRQLTVFNELD